MHALTLLPGLCPASVACSRGEPGDEAGQALQLLDARLIISFSHLSKLEFSAKSSPYIHVMAYNIHYNALYTSVV